VKFNSFKLKLYLLFFSHFFFSLPPLLPSFPTPNPVSRLSQATPTLEGTTAAGVALGGYVVKEFGVCSGAPQLILVSTGTEVALSIEVAKVRSGLVC
jgi:hypothetical protein